MKSFKIEIFLFLVICFSLLAEAKTPGISLKASPNSIVITSGLETTRVVYLEIRNNQNLSDEFVIIISGSYPYIDKVKLSQENLLISINESKSIKIEIPIPKNAVPGNFDINISASSKKNLDVWSSYKINISIFPPRDKGYTHVQPRTDNISVLGPAALGINYYGNLRLIDRGYIINNYDECCVGSRMKLDSHHLSGEWFTKGGPTDSPPILWVEDLEQVKTKINEGRFSTTVYDAYICQWRFGEYEKGVERCVARVNVICSSSCFISHSSSIDYIENSKEVLIKNEGEHIIDSTCPVNCILFADRKNMKFIMSYFFNKVVNLSDVYGYAEIKGNLKDIRQRIVVKAKRGEIGPDLEITSSKISKETLKEGEKFYIRLNIKNVGDKEARFDSISLNLRSYEFVYYPNSINPGEEGEILIKTRAAEGTNNIRAEFNYRANSIGCLPTLKFKEEFNIGNIKLAGKLKRCGSNSDCASQEVCCEGYCMDAKAGLCDDLDGDGNPETWIGYQ